jgi:integral membrane protein
MPTAPKVTDFPRIRVSLAVYRVLAYATGVFLLILCVEIILKYIFGVEIELGGPFGFIAFVQSGTVTATNLSIVIQITHGYLYLAYLVADFVLITFMRWPISRFILIAAGGVIPLLSFFTERRIHREVTEYLSARQAETAPTEVPHQ